MRVFLALCAILFTNFPAQADEPQFRLIDGSGGAPIALMEWGDKDGPEILFLHGFGFSSEFWTPQVDDPVLGGFHMAAIDLRGHGASAKPWKAEDLVDTKIWAEDVAASIEAADMTRPVIVGWSYGGYVALDYVRHFGIDRIAGLILIGSPAGLTDRLHPGAEGAVEGYADAARQRASLSLKENMKGNDFMARLMSATDLPDAVAAEWAAQGNRVPVYVSLGLRQGRSLENRDIQDQLTLPVAIAVGGKDASMPFEALENVSKALPRGEYWYFENAGHAVSYDVAQAFNARLARYVEARQ